jgi:hypothetical protein
MSLANVHSKVIANVFVPPLNIFYNKKPTNIPWVKKKIHDSMSMNIVNVTCTYLI